MKINKSDLKDSINFLWVAILFFLLTVDVAFPFVMFIMKVVFYIIGSLLLILGVSTMIRSFFGKNREEETLVESQKK